jgi:type III secretion system FlhB-like substrate exporter
MNRQTAELLIAAVKKIDMAVGEIYDLSDTLDDENLKRQIKMTIGGVVVDVHAWITREIAHEYPDLHPDRVEIDAERQARKSQT